MLLFWDIDGTLLTTGRAGIYAWEDALREVAGTSVNLDDFDTAGVPDFGIARRLLELYGGKSAPDESMIRHLVTRYEDLLPTALPRRKGRVLPNVREILTALSGEPGVRSMLLTGNTRRGAEAKLRHYELAQFFDGGSFSESDTDREAIARHAVERGRAYGPLQTFVIGDTPHDVRCGRAVGARTIAVATGAYDGAALAATGAWRVLQTLPPAPAFMALLTGSEVGADV